MADQWALVSGKVEHMHGGRGLAVDHAVCAVVKDDRSCLCSVQRKPRGIFGPLFGLDGKSGLEILSILTAN